MLMPRPRPQRHYIRPPGAGSCMRAFLSSLVDFGCVSRTENTSASPTSTALHLSRFHLRRVGPGETHVKPWPRPQPFSTTLLGFCSSECLSPAAASLPAHSLSEPRPHPGHGLLGSMVAGSLWRPQPRSSVHPHTVGTLKPLLTYKSFGEVKLLS